MPAAPLPTSRIRVSCCIVKKRRDSPDQILGIGPVITQIRPVSNVLPPVSFVTLGKLPALPVVFFRIVPGVSSVYERYGLSKTAFHATAKGSTFSGHAHHRGP